MKKHLQTIATATLVVSLSMFFAACSKSSSSDSGSSGPTSIATTTQGAKSAAASTNSAKSAANSTAQLSSLGAIGGANKKAPAIKVPFGTNRSTQVVGKFAKRFSPIVKKANAFKVSATGFPITMPCGTSSAATAQAGDPNTMTMDESADQSTFTITFVSCMDNGTKTDGQMVINNTTFTIGTASAPFTTTTYAVASDGTVSTAVDQKDVTVVTMSWSETGTAPNTTESMVINGSFENWDYIADTHEKSAMNNFTIKSVNGTSKHGSSTFDVATETIDGGMSSNIYPTAKAATATYSATESFAAFELIYEHPQLGVVSADDFDYFTMNGSFTITTVPADSCIDGTFSIVTSTAIKTDNNTGNNVAGKMTINSNTVVVFNADNTVTITVDGKAQTMTDKELDALCGF